MLKEIQIQNFLFIEKALLSLDSGFNVMTGETGAGKSIFLGAMSITFGEKVTDDMIRPGADFLRVTSVFEIKNDKAILAMLEELGLDTGLDETDPVLTMRREIRRDGRSRCFINDAFTNISSLKHLAGYLLDLHSQRENQKLYKPTWHRVYYDNFLKLDPLLDKYLKFYKAWKNRVEKLTELIKRKKEIRSEKDFLEFTINELNGKLMPEDEYQKSREKIKDFMNRETRVEAAATIDEHLTQALSFLNTAVEKSKGTGFEEFESLSSRLQEAYYEIDDVKNALAPGAYESKISHQNIDSLNAKCAAVERLKKKYGMTIDDLYKKLDGAREKLSFLENSAIEMKETVRACQKYYNEALQAAEELHQHRILGKKPFESTLREELSVLGMKNSSFDVKIFSKNHDRVRASDNAVSETDANGQTNETSILNEAFYTNAFELTESGYDDVCFLYRSSREMEAKNLSDIASGGEASRIMLALKKTLIESLPAATLILDEIDTGIGGETGLMVGKKIKEISAGKQVFVITHLAQIAKYARAHFKVDKITEGGKTKTSIKKLDSKARVAETARMLSGNSERSENLEFAADFLKKDRH